MQRFFLLIMMLMCLSSGISYAKGEITLNYKDLATSETKVWQSYYDKNPVTILINLTDYINELYGIKNKIKSAEIATIFTYAFMKFAAVPQDATQEEYEKSILPSLTKAYQTLKQSINATWTPREVAVADLSWMIARRHIKTLEPEIVANKMVNIAYLMYGKKDNHHFIRAAYLRAVAGRYRDQCQDAWGGINSDDWKIVNSLLEKSYLELSQGIVSNI